MIKTVIAILLALPLLSVAPAAAPTTYHLTIGVQTGAQACTPQLAKQSGTYLRQVVIDPAGVPYGEVAAWSCGADAESAIAELKERQTAMESEAAAYRAAHPIGGVK